MPTIVGAGSVGLALGARLGAAGVPVRFLTRRREAADSLTRNGIRAEDPKEGSTRVVPVEADCLLPTPATGSASEPLLLCVRLPELPALAETLRAEAPGHPVVCFQNDVEAEPLLASLGFPVIGGVWRQTCTRVSDHAVRFVGAGRVIIGDFANAPQGAVDRVTGWLELAGYDVGRSKAITEDKWLKLCINLMSAPNALVRREDHGSEAFVEIKARLLEEARDVVAAAGVVARSCDGRDRSLDEEIVFQRESLARGTSARALPLYNQVWTSLRQGAPGEAVAYHRRFVRMGREHGVATPTNERLIDALEYAITREAGPESVLAAELLG